MSTRNRKCEWCGKPVPKVKPFYGSPDGGALHLECYDPFNRAGYAMRTILLGEPPRPSAAMQRAIDRVAKAKAALACPVCKGTGKRPS